MIRKDTKNENINNFKENEIKEFKNLLTIICLVKNKDVDVVLKDLLSYILYKDVKFDDDKLVIANLRIIEENIHSNYYSIQYFIKKNFDVDVRIYNEKEVFKVKNYDYNNVYHINVYNIVKDMLVKLVDILDCEALLTNLNNTIENKEDFKLFSW